MKTLGIDPGLKGACVALDASGQLAGYFDVPLLDGDKHYDEQQMVAKLKCVIGSGPVAVWIERQQPMPLLKKNKQTGELEALGGSVSAFRKGEGYGLWRMLCAALGLPYTVCTPVSWQRAMLRDIEGAGKSRSLLACARLFPTLPLTRPRGHKATLDGRADAALIAAYGLRRGQGEFA